MQREGNDQSLRMKENATFGGGYLCLDQKNNNFQESLNPKLSTQYLTINNKLLLSIRT